MAMLLLTPQWGRRFAVSAAGRPGYQNERGRVLVSIWNIPKKTRKGEFDFLMSRVPGVESWQFVSGPGKSSAGYAYCECPTMEDAKETIALLGRFQTRGQKFKAGLFDPEGLELKEEITHVLEEPLAEEEQQQHEYGVRSSGQIFWKGDGGYKRPRKRVETIRVRRLRPPNQRLGYRHLGREKQIGEGECSQD